MPETRPPYNSRRRRRSPVRRNTPDQVVWEEVRPDLFPARKNPRRMATVPDLAGLRVQTALVRAKGWKSTQAPQIRSSDGVAKLVREYEDQVQEVFLALMLNGQHRVTGIYEVHRGTLTSVEVSPSDVFRAAVVAAAPALIVVHNHPSGQPDLSADDKALALRLKKAATLLGIDLLDHVVVAKNGYISAAERGLI